MEQRIHDSLLGLSVGDAFGETFFGAAAADRVAARQLSPPVWRWTDDTAMALGLVRVLEDHGTVDRDALAATFAENYRNDPYRGYGAGAQDILGAVARGEPWSTVAAAAFGGQGSMGNGAAMRVAPLGAWFAGDLDRVVREAAASAEPTHAHPDGAAGAIAVAVAAAVACLGAGPDAVWAAVLARTPDGPTLQGLHRACSLGPGIPVGHAARVLGTGRRVTSSDTVPFVLWCLTRHLDDYEAALWTTVAGLGDRDTTCAMVGGVLGARLGRDAIPAAWRSAAEPWTLRA